jgi:hypothetical protein
VEAKCDGNTFSMWIEGLRNSTRYTFSVHAVNAAGPGPSSPLTTPVMPTASFSRVGSDGVIGRSGKEVSFGPGKDGSALVESCKPGSTARIQLVEEGDLAFIGVCRSDYNVDEPPFLQGAHSANSQGFLYSDGGCRVKQSTPNLYPPRSFLQANSLCAITTSSVLETQSRSILRQTEAASTGL